MPVALIATDLDGTLVRSDGTVSPRTRAAIQAAHDAGIVVAFVTARPPRSVDELCEHIGVGGLAICCNGALLYDLARRSVVASQYFDRDIGHALIGELRQSAPGVTFAIQYGTDFAQESQFPPYWDDWHPEPIPRVECALTLLRSEVAKIIAHHPAYDAETLAALVEHQVGGRAEISHSGLPIIELAPAGVSKATGLGTLCRRLGIEAADVVAFGDMANDLEMLAFAGYSVAVANAHRNVLAVVSEVTLSNDADGVPS